MRQKLKSLWRQLNNRKLELRVVALLIIMGVVDLGVFYGLNNLIAAPVTKPNVLIIDDTTSVGGTASSASAIKTYLDGTGLFTTSLCNTSNWPTAQAAAATYDTVIYSAGNRTTPLNTTEQTWLDSFLNTYYGHLIVEGEAVLGSYVNTGTSPRSSTNTVITSNILKATGFSSYRTSATTLMASNVTHPVSYGMSTTGTNYTNVTSNWTGHYSNGKVLARWGSSRAPYYILSAWEGTNQRERLVFMDFDWDNWTSQTEREKLMNNAVKWTSEFCEVKLDSLAPASVTKGTKNVKMAKLTFSTYATATNSNTNTITSITVYNQGTALNSSINLVRLYESDNLGNIIGVNPVAQGTVGSDGKAVIAGMSLPVTAGTDKYYVVTYDITDPADESKTVNVRLDPTFSTREKGRVKISGGNLSGDTTILNTTPPDIPLYVKGTNLTTGTTARVDWHAVTSWDLVGYNVYRAEISTPGGAMGSYNRLNGSVLTNIYYNDSGLTEFHRYYYKVRSQDIANNESPDSDVVEVVPNRPPVTPTGQGVTNPGTGGRLSLTWIPASPEPNDPFNGNTPDLAGYDIYAATSSLGPFLKINEATITGTSYIATGLKDGLTYYFKVCAIDRYGAESPLTAYFSGTPTDTTAPNILESYPTPAQDYVETTAVVQVKFDDVLKVSGDLSQLITLEKKNQDNTYTRLSGTVSWDESSNELMFTPDAPLSTIGNYRVTVKGGVSGCTNLAGLYLAQDSQWTFGTLLNPHKDFKTNNTLCGYCHSAHSAKGPNIIREPTVLDLCFMCHDGSGSSYDVKGGKYFNGKENVPMAAGGYDLAMGSTSTHFSDLASNVYGSPGYKMNIDCNTCHEPHGSTNYRNIRTKINGKPVTLTAIVYGPAYAVKTASGYEVTSYVYGWEQFCGTCHSEYQIYHSVTTITGEENWRHRTDIPLTGGSTNGRWLVSYPTPGLYTTLPTIGKATGANITNIVLFSGGSLSPGTYNYAVTTVNAVGESVYGNIAQIVNPSSSGKIKLVWDRIPNAYQYRIYRYKGVGDPKTMSITNFNLIATVPDVPVEYFDDGSVSPQTQSPPTSSNSNVGCITCHMVHGTPAVVDSGDPTRLRRYDNDGICQDCHKK